MRAKWRRESEREWRETIKVRESRVREWMQGAMESDNSVAGVDKECAIM